MEGFDYGPIFFVPITLLFCVGFGLYGKRKQLPKAYYIFMVIACLYVNVAISLTCFPLMFMEREEFNAWNNISFSLDLSKNGMAHLLLNVILTIPLGIGLQFITNLKNKSRLIVVVALSALFELAQLLLITTLHPFSIIFDIQDLICNIAGGCIGYGLIFVFDGLFKNGEQINSANFFGYIKKVCQNCANKKSSLSLD